MGERGRPTKWRDEYLKQVVTLLGKGFTDSEIAELWGISESTYYGWQETKEEFLEATKEGRRIHTVKLCETSLMKRAEGMVVTETFKDGNGEVTKTVEKELPPDVVALKMVLHNRDPNRWKEKQTIEHSGKIEGSDDRQLITDLLKQKLREGK